MHVEPVIKPVLSFCLLQAEGLSGHLAHKWDKLIDSVWTGGSRGDTGGLHEVTPYVSSD